MNQQELHLFEVPMASLILMSKAFICARLRTAAASAIAVRLLSRIARLADISIAVLGPAIGDDARFRLRVPGTTGSVCCVSAKAI
jgi:ornithine cyclodeaminase/alanine dehydrogenase-like protein (mu-crystallin family)